MNRYVEYVYVCVFVRALLRVRALPPLVSRCQVVTLLHQDVESTGFIAVADVQQDLTAHSGVSIVTGLTVHAHHAVYAALLDDDHRQKGEKVKGGEQNSKQRQHTRKEEERRTMKQRNLKCDRVLMKYGRNKLL